MAREDSLVDCRNQDGAVPRRVSRRAVLSLTLVTSGISACGMLGPKGPAPREPVNVSGSLQASADLNPSVTQRPSPLTLRIYELKSAVAFERADFMALFLSDQTALGGDVLAREEITLQPGETKPYNKLLNVETRFIAVLGAYRNSDASTWRAIAAVPDGRKQKISVRAGARVVSVQVSP